MARRSARISKAQGSPVPSESPEKQVASPKPSVAPLPSLTEADEPGDDSWVTAETDSPIPTATRTPKKAKSQLPTSIHTPTDKGLKPSRENLHPEHHHQSTTTPFEEARWLGFQAKGSQTVPAKGAATSEYGLAQGTPTKSSDAQKPLFSSPDFKFRFKRPSEMHLSPAARKMMEESRKEANENRKSMNTAADEFDTTAADNNKAMQAMVTPARKTAKPKSSRFSDIHKKQFAKMQAIGEKARPKPADTSLKRSPSKPDVAASTGRTLERSPSKPDLTASASRTLERSPSRPSLAARASQSLKRSPSKAELDKADVPPSSVRSTARMVAPSRYGEQKATPTAKRTKRHETDDASKARPVSPDEKVDNGTTPFVPNKHMNPHGHGIAPSKATSRLPQSPSLSRLLTPTKSSLARSESMKNLQSGSKLPSLAKSQSTVNLTPSARLKSGFQKTSEHLRSILRGPQRLYSNDPEKIAAGTHIPAPSRPFMDINKDFPSVPATAPVSRTKRVDFTNSAIQKAERDESVPSSPPPATPVRAASEIPAESNTVSYPRLPSANDGDRRTTLSDLHVPGSFTFRSERQPSFDPATASGGGRSTIRRVRASDANQVVSRDSPFKRKLEAVAEASDKENQEKMTEEEEESRPTKKRRGADPAPGAKTPAKTSRLPRAYGGGGASAKGKKTGSMTPSRLNLLAMPKRRGN